MTSKQIESFSSKMKLKIKEKDTEHGVEGWLDDDSSISYLINRLNIKHRKLTKAIDDCDINKAQKLCVDVGNFSMMIDDRLSFIKGGRN